MTNQSCSLEKPLVQEITSRSYRYSRRSLAILCFGIGVALAVWVTPEVESPQSAIDMASTMPHHMASIMPRPIAYGNTQFGLQSRPQPPLQPRLSRQSLNTRQVSAAAEFNPPPYQETSKKFMEAYNKLPASMFQSFIDDYLQTLHFYVYSRGYKYDGLFALGLRELFVSAVSTFEKLAGSGEGEQLWNAVCSAVNLDGAKVTKDAETMTAYAKATSPADILKQMEGTEKPSDNLVASAFEGEKKHIQFRSIGLFKVMEYSGVQIDKDKAAEWSKAAKIDNDKLMKDLQSFRTNLRRMQQGEEMMRDMMARNQKKKDEKKAEKKEAKKEEPKKEEEKKESV